MKNNNRLKIAEIILLILVWVVLIAAPIFFNYNGSFEWQDVLNPLETIVPLFLIFLINRFILVPKLLFRKRNFKYVLSAIGLIGLFTFGTYLYTVNLGARQQRDPIGQHRLPPPALKRPGNGLSRLPTQPQPHRPIPPYANLLIFSFLLIGFDTGLKASFRLAETEKAKSKLEKEHVGTQLAFLRNQVSPHFFMNTLNNIHAMIDYDTREAKESIIRLSKLMRHLLYDSEIEKIPIQKEIEFLRNYVDLMKLRFSEKVKINLQIPEQFPDKSIHPLLFTSYLENAFKHGISYHTTSFINIVFLCTQDKLTFKIRNSNPKNDRGDESSGIGIENSRKRLDLIYGDGYFLEIQDSKEEYYVQLIIPI